MTEFIRLYKQAKVLTLANMKSRYRKTFAGFLWVVMNPLVMYAIQSYVFKRVLSSTGDDYPLFLLGGLLPWLFINQSLDMTTSIFVTYSSMLKANFVHPLVILCAQIFDNAINFIAAFLVVLLIAIVSGNKVYYGIVFLPVPLTLLFFGTFSISLVLATINVFFRDTRFLVSVVLNVLFFTTPIFYPESLVPVSLRWLLYVNPIYFLIRPIREAIYRFDVGSFLVSCGISFSTSLITFVCAAFLWRKLKNELYFKL